MIARRTAAVVVAVALIVGALAIRRAIDDEGGAVGEPLDGTAAATLVCPPELADVCRSVGADLTVRIEESGATLERLALDGPSSDAWLTFDPFPAAVEQLRARGALPEISFDTSVLASSPIALVLNGDRAARVEAACSDEVEWRCLGDSDLSIGFAGSPDSGIGLLGATTAASGYAPGSIPFGDALFEVWLRRAVSSVNRSQFSSGSAVATIQVRPSAMDVAVGAEAELAEERRGAFALLYAEPMGRADVILAAPDGTTVPDDLADALTVALAAAGWGGPTASSGAAPDPSALLATRDFWRNL